ncbi:hypothetical protein BD414DRAFT_530974 [Trametes punicea]|nr:hypothetical protein BD414DRAFT_530974 [Trametes punicea]
MALSTSSPVSTSSSRAAVAIAVASTPAGLFPRPRGFMEATLRLLGTWGGKLPYTLIIRGSVLGSSRFYAAAKRFIEGSNAWRDMRYELSTTPGISQKTGCGLDSRPLTTLCMSPAVFSRSRHHLFAYPNVLSLELVFRVQQHSPSP